MTRIELRGAYIKAFLWKSFLVSGIVLVVMKELRRATSKGDSRHPPNQPSSGLEAAIYGRITPRALFHLISR